MFPSFFFFRKTGRTDEAVLPEPRYYGNICTMRTIIFYSRSYNYKIKK